jgi:hypothetical protein
VHGRLPSSVFSLVRSWVRPPSSWLTSSFYRPRWRSAAGGFFEKKPLYRGKTKRLNLARLLVRIRLIVSVRIHLLKMAWAARGPGAIITTSVPHRPLASVVWVLVWFVTLRALWMVRALGLRLDSHDGSAGQGT